MTLGTLVGIMPGIGATAAVAVLAPLATSMGSAAGLGMLCGIYYGSKYGGSTTSILLNVPGEPSAVVTCLDGYPLARQGQAGRALAVAAVASFVAGVAGVLGLAVLLPQSAALARAIGPIEQFALVTLGLSCVIVLVGGRPLRAAVAVLLGLAFSFVGTDIISGSSRLTFGRPELLDGLGVVPVTVGLFAVGEALWTLGKGAASTAPRAETAAVFRRDDLRSASGAIGIGSAVGFGVGVVPGAGATVAAFVAYAVTRRLSRRPEEFGSGSISGVAAPEAANNAEPMGALLPLLTLGIAGSGTTAVLLGALPYWGIAPGALLTQQQPELVWAVVGSMLVGNTLLLVLNLPLVPLFARVLRLQPGVLFAIVVSTAVVGVYVVDRDPFDLLVLAAFGALGYACRGLGIPAAPMVLAFVLGGVVERGLRAALIITAGDPFQLFSSVLASALLLTAAAILVSPVARRLLRRA